MCDSHRYPWKLNLFNNVEDYVVFLAEILFNSNNLSIVSEARNALVKKLQIKIKLWYIIYSWSDKVIKGIVVNLTYQSINRAGSHLKLR